MNGPTRDIVVVVLVLLGISVSLCLGFSVPSSVGRTTRTTTRRISNGVVPKQKTALFVAANTNASTTSRTTTTSSSSSETPAKVALSKNQEALGSRKFPRTWVPLASVFELDPDRPTPLEFLDQNYVCYKDTHLDQWIVADDVCPHRLAPLSEGRISRTDNATTLQCSYHGWEFDPNGSCVGIPQATPQVLEKARVSPLSKTTVYPTRVHKNVLFAWPWPEDCLGIAHEFPRGHPEGLMSGIVGGGDTPTTYTRDLPYGWDTLVENLIDPAHIPFAHHGLQGKRDDAIPIVMTVPQHFPKDPNGEMGYIFEWQDRTMGKYRAGTGEFMAPYGVAYQGTFFKTKEEADATRGIYMKARKEQLLGMESIVGFGDAAADDDETTTGTPNLGPFRLGVLCIPTKPGWSRAIIMAGRAKQKESETAKADSEVVVEKENTTATKKKKKKPSLVGAIFGALPPWVMHLLSNKFLDSDLMFLHRQEQERLRHSESATSGYYMPAASDRCISALRKWVPKHTDYTTTTVLPPPVKDRSVLFDRYTQHTSHCKHCQEGMEWLQTKVRRGAYLGLIASVVAGHCFDFFKGFKLLTKLTALLSLGILRLISKIEPAFRVGEFKHYENH